MKNMTRTAVILCTLSLFCIGLFATDAGAQISNVQTSIKKDTVSTGTASQIVGANKTPASSSQGTAAAKTTKKTGTSAASNNAIIPDDEFTNPDFMTQAEMTALLASLDSPMAKEYEGVKPAEIIMEVAKENNVNPLVILATMQKENGLVQSKKKITKFKLDWAMGVGVYDNGKMNQGYKGFKKQITGAADTFRKNFDKGKALLDAKKSTKLPINYGKESFSPTNAATYSLYSYTPHTHGAKLFTSIYKSYKNKLEKVRAAGTATAPATTTTAPARITN